MRYRLGDLTIRNLIISFIILYSIMPIVGRLTSRYLTTYFYMALVVVLVVLILALDRPENLNEYLTFLLPFLLYSLLTYFTTHETLVMWGYQTLLFLFPVILGYYFYQDKSRIIDTYSRIIVFAIIVTMITTIIGCIENPNAARILATVDSGDADSFTYDMKNIGGYSFVYYMILLYPVLILSYKSKRIKLLPTVIISVVILFTVIYSEYTTALLLYTISSMLFFSKRNLSSRGIIVISVFALLFLVFFSDIIVNLLKWMSSVVDSKAISMRLDALAEGVSGIEASEDNRIKLYNMSLSRFFENPLFGTLFASYMINGGHSHILDSLANYGLLGGTVMFFMYKRSFVRFFLPYKDRPGFGYVIWTFIQALILSTVNTGMFLEVLCLFAPVLFHWIYKDVPTEEVVNNEDTVDRQHAAGPAG